MIEKCRFGRDDFDGLSPMEDHMLHAALAVRFSSLCIHYAYSSWNICCGLHHFRCSEGRLGALNRLPVPVRKVPDYFHEHSGTTVIYGNERHAAPFQDLRELASRSFTRPTVCSTRAGLTLSA